MLKYIFISFYLLLVGQQSFGQFQPERVKRTQSIALGIDLAPFFLRASDNERTGFALSGRYGLKEKVFAVAELGYENVQLEKEKYQGNPERLFYSLDYTSNGSFIKVGFDYNIFNVVEEEPNNMDNVLIGLRYGIAFQEHRYDNFVIGNGYWGDYNSYTLNESVTSHWTEAIFGIRTEVLRNLFLGAGVRVKFLLFTQKTTIMDPFSVPGIGKIPGGVNLGFHYTVEYQIPFGKKQSSTTIRMPEQ